MQAKQTLRTVNAAKSMYEMSTHASIYVPLSIPSQLPQYVNINRRSEWHTSALLSMSLETMTLPSRNRDLGQRGDLEMMSAALNINGQQRLASLQCSVIQSSEAKGSEAKTEEYMAHQDDRMAGSISSGWEFPNHGSGKAHALDMEFSNCNSSGQPAGLGRDHVFGQVESLRGCSEVHGDGDEDDGMTERKHRVALPMEARLVFSLFSLFSLYLLAGVVDRRLNRIRGAGGEARGCVTCNRGILHYRIGELMRANQISNSPPIPAPRQFPRYRLSAIEFVEKFPRRPHSLVDHIRNVHPHQIPAAGRESNDGIGRA